jgi:hypothetical protein
MPTPSSPRRTSARNTQHCVCLRSLPPAAQRTRATVRGRHAPVSTLHTLTSQDQGPRRHIPSYAAQPLSSDSIDATRTASTRCVGLCVARASRRRRRPHAGPRAADDRPAPQPFPALVHALIITRRAPSYSPPNAPRQQKPNGECTGLPFFPRGATRRIGLQSHAITRRSPGGAAGSLPCSQAAASRPPALQGLQRPRLRRVSLGVSRRAGRAYRRETPCRPARPSRRRRPPPPPC